MSKMDDDLDSILATIECGNWVDAAKITVELDIVQEVVEALISDRRAKDSITLIGIILDKEFLIPNKDLVCVR